MIYNGVMDNVKYIALDLETPNRQNNSICQIGLVFLDENLKEVKSIEQIINPEAKFSIENKKIHHITENDVKGKPTFKEFWNEYGEYFKNCIIICHNHWTDLVVIDKQLKDYEIDFMEYEVRYIDTLDICKSKSKCFRSNKLIDVCKELNLPIFNWHSASGDSKMCAELFKYLKENGYNFEIKKYSGYSKDKREHHINNYSNGNYSAETKALRSLQDYLKEISKDRVITNKELVPLIKWIAANDNLSGTHQYDLICKSIENVYNDGIIDENESKTICDTIEEIINPKNKENFFVSDDIVIDFKDKNFVITGDFENGWTREKCKELIIEKGGKVKKNVSGKTNYLIVGNVGSNAWKFGNYGSKITDAIKNETPIVKEETFIKNVNK